MMSDVISSLSAQYKFHVELKSVLLLELVRYPFIHFFLSFPCLILPQSPGTVPAHIKFEKLINGPMQQMIFLKCKSYFYRLYRDVFHLD